MNILPRPAPEISRRVAPAQAATAAFAALLALWAALPATALAAEPAANPPAAAREAAAAATQDGVYAVLGAGAALVAHDCGFYYECERSSTAVVRAALGWRSGAWSVEGTVLRWGSTEVGDAWVARTLSMRAAGVVGTRYWVPSPYVQLSLRLGALRVRHERTGDGTLTTTRPLLGLGLLYDLNPRLQLEATLDLTGAEGNNVSSTVVQNVMAGLRWRF